MKPNSTGIPPDVGSLGLSFFCWSIPYIPEARRYFLAYGVAMYTDVNPASSESISGIIL